jgi:hypothetical protein
MTKPITITLGAIRAELLDLLSMPDDTQVFFGAGDLTWYRTKNRGPIVGTQLMQIEFNEVYTVTNWPDAHSS